MFKLISTADFSNNLPTGLNIFNLIASQMPLLIRWHMLDPIGPDNAGFNYLVLRNAPWLKRYHPSWANKRRSHKSIFVSLCILLFFLFLPCSFFCVFFIYFLSLSLSSPVIVLYGFVRILTHQCSRQMTEHLQIREISLGLRGFLSASEVDSTKKQKTIVRFHIPRFHGQWDV